jgi:hypothetical protein
MSPVSQIAGAEQKIGGYIRGLYERGEVAKRILVRTASWRLSNNEGVPVPNFTRMNVGKDRYAEKLSHLRA